MIQGGKSRPSRGAWIEIATICNIGAASDGRAPHGARELKCDVCSSSLRGLGDAPLAGHVGTDFLRSGSEWPIKDTEMFVAPELDNPIELRRNNRFSADGHDRHCGGRLCSFRFCFQKGCHKNKKCH